MLRRAIKKPRNKFSNGNSQVYCIFNRNNKTRPPSRSHI
uniref:Uncharacterized protein n=1 Tax=Rhizophora mucronata TaxID=61149 RepID=A0A2P2P084_RHIMU